MNSKTRKRIVLKDRKNWFVYLFWSLINLIVTTIRFKRVQVIGRENLPVKGPFLLVSNHVSRWDGLIVYRTLARPSNFMVSPNELLGLQGQVLMSMGSFPADPRSGIVEFAQRQLLKGENIVVFPEGNIFTDGVTHPFKNGAARIALTCAEAGINVPIVPAAINYASDKTVAQIVIGEPISTSEYIERYRTDQVRALRCLSDRMHREVCFLRETLGCVGDRLALYGCGSGQSWIHLSKATEITQTQAGNAICLRCAEPAGVASTSTEHARAAG